MLSGKKLCFVGAGAMAEAVLRGLLQKQIVKPGQITVTNKEDRFRLNELIYNFGVVADAERKLESIQEADVLILAMKPNDMYDSLLEIKEYTHKGQLILSVVAGMSTDFITDTLGTEAPVVRTMPNTSAVVGLSATGMCAGRLVKEEHMHVAQTIFESIGIVFITEENKLDAVTGVAGSGPAYIYYLVEGMIQGGIDSGLKEEEARLLVYQTLLGAGRMIKETKQNPDYLREQITSPNGTTQKGLETLDEYHFLEAVCKAVKNATSRSKELGELLSKNSTR